jgi:hypothetical protein
VIWPRERPVHTIRRALYCARCEKGHGKKRRPDLVGLRMREEPSRRQKANMTASQAMALMTSNRLSWRRRGKSIEHHYLPVWSLQSAVPMPQIVRRSNPVLLHEPKHLLRECCRLG